MSDNGYIETYSGKMIDPLNPSTDAIYIEDIAHALSQICRFTGHTREFYSVAQHSVIIASHLPPSLHRCGLLHDASEAYLCDLAKPVKHRMLEYQEIEDRLMLCIAKKYDISWPLPHEVAHADLRALETERRDLMPGNEPPWGPPMAPPFAEKISGWSPEGAELAFLRAWHKIGGWA